MSLACPTCGRPIAAEGDNRVCGHCLLALGLAAGQAEVLPGPAELEPLLAELNEVLAA